MVKEGQLWHFYSSNWTQATTSRFKCDPRDQKYIIISFLINIIHFLHFLCSLYYTQNSAKVNKNVNAWSLMVLFEKQKSKRRICFWWNSIWKYTNSYLLFTFHCLPDGLQTQGKLVLPVNILITCNNVPRTFSSSAGSEERWRPKTWRSQTGPA